MAKRSRVLASDSLSGLNSESWLACAWMRACGRSARTASSGDPGPMPARVSITSAMSSHPPIARFGPRRPAQRRRDVLGHQLDRAQDEGMRWIDRMDLYREVCGALECGVALNRGNHLVGRTDMHVECLDQVAHQIARRQIAGGGQTMAQARQ